jgi:hypothetical protein
MLYVSVKKFGNRDDFIGHIGGDDFVFISTPDAYKKICQNFVFMFDKIVPFHYSEADRKQGFIVARDRSHTVKKIPLMSVSVAIVNRSENSNIKNIVEINEKVAEIKRYLKGIPGSKFMAERRNFTKGEFFPPEFNKKEEADTDSYKPLGQILLERNVISAEQLDEALNIHWKRGIILGEVLKELGFVKEEELTEALDFQRANLNKINHIPTLPVERQVLD